MYRLVDSAAMYLFYTRHDAVASVKGRKIKNKKNKEKNNSIT